MPIPTFVPSFRNSLLAIHEHLCGTLRSTGQFESAKSIRFASRTALEDQHSEETRALPLLSPLKNQY
jgi:hypothetical protein